MTIQQNNDEAETYSFTIIRGSIKKTFRSKDMYEIATWFRMIKKYSVLTEFEEDYEVIEGLGSGHFATVYKIKSTVNDMFYAAKVIEKEQLTTKNLVIYFLII